MLASHLRTWLMSKIFHSNKARQLDASTTRPTSSRQHASQEARTSAQIHGQHVCIFSETSLYIQCSSPRYPLARQLFWTGWIWRFRLYLVSASLIFPRDSLQWHGQFNCLLLWWRWGIEVEDDRLLLEKYCRIRPSVNTWFTPAVAPRWSEAVRVSSRALLGVLSAETTVHERFGPPWGSGSVTSHSLTDQIYTVEFTH